MDVTLVVHGPASTPETEAVVSGVGLRLRGNPVRDEVDYELVIAERGVVRVDLVAIDGRRVLTLWNGSLGAGVHALTADLGEDGVVAGVYWIRASSHGEFTQQQVIVVPR
jgi:hypothetical protein